ncbi:hypothetical protein [Paracidovorax citrulli]|uniref:hypothetical protein n=1 Tax=Paracidovorax citrulli TaxID=80869 RepID=UPI003FA701A4
MGLFLDALGGLAKAALDANEQLRQDAKQRAYVEQQKGKMALTCRRCHKAAEPVEGTGNRYLCSCGNRFAAARHYL